MAGGNFRAEWRDLKRFGKVIEATQILSHGDSLQLAYDLAEIRDACRSLPGRIEKFVGMLDRKNADLLLMLDATHDLAGELQYHLPAHLRKAFRRVSKIADHFHNERIHTGWGDYLYTLADFTERAVSRLESIRAGVRRLPGEPQSLLQEIKRLIHDLEGQLRPPNRKARQDGFRRIRQWHRRIAAAGYRTEFRRTPLTRPARVDWAEIDRRIRNLGRLASGRLRRAEVDSTRGRRQRAVPTKRRT